MPSTSSPSARWSTASTPGVIPFRKAQLFEVHVSGGEYNVAANLSDCFGMRTGVATAMVDYGIGELVQARVRETGVTPFYKWFEHDGVRGPNIATVYSDRGQGVRPPVVFYNRANEAGALLKPGDFDWAQVIAGGVRWFHSGGIFAALSETTSELILEGMQAAKAPGRRRLVRPQLPRQTVGVGRRRASAPQEVCGRSSAASMRIFGNEEDLQKGLGIAGPDVAAKSKLDPDAFFAMIDRVVEQFPNIKMVATTLREVHSTNRHDWAAVLWLRRPAVRQPDVPSRRAGPHRRRRRLRGGPDLRLAEWADAGGGAASGLGARGVADDVPRRRDDGAAGGGRGVRQGRLGAGAAVGRGGVPKPTGCNRWACAIPHFFTRSSTFIAPLPRNPR